MSALAFNVQTGELIDLVSALENNETYEELAQKYADRPNAYCCAECLAIEKGLSDIELASFRSLGVAADSSFRRGCVQKRLDVETGKYKKVNVRPAFFHTTRLIDEDGNFIERPCESDTSVHHAFCRYIAGPGRGWLLGTGENGVIGNKDPRHVITVMARYKKDPSFREPDISVLWARDEQTAKKIKKDFENGNTIIDWNLCIGLTAVEVQKSQISKPELINRTKDHLKHFTDVRWVFTAGNKPVPPREWLADQGLPAYIIEEEIDKSRIIGVKVLNPPKKTKTYDKKRNATICLRSVLMYWLGLGVAFPEALARAKADVQDLKEGKHIERLNVFQQQLHEIFSNYFLDPKQIWLRHQYRQEKT